MSTEATSRPGAWRSFGDGALAACFSEAVTLPLEVAKVRLQLQVTPTGATPKYSGILSTLRTIAQQERWIGLFKGMETGMHKQVIYSGLRLGIYDHLELPENAPLHQKVGTALLSTAIGVTFANPADVVQTRYMAHSSPVSSTTGIRAPNWLRMYQSQGAFKRESSHHPGSTSSPGKSVPMWSAPPSRGSRSYHSSCRYPHSRLHIPLGLYCLAPPPHHPAGLTAQRYRSIFHHHRRRVQTNPAPTTLSSRSGPTTSTSVPLQNARKAYFIIAREEGFVKGLYRGFGPNFACSCIQGAAEIVTYDSVKKLLMDRGMEDGIPCHLVSGMTAGAVATICSNPLDIVTTRLMMAKSSASHKPPSMLEVCKDMWCKEGVKSFYKGVGPNMLRIGSFNVVMWLAYEQIRRIGKP